MVGSSWLGLRELFRRIQASTAVRRPSRVERTCQMTELNPPAEEQIGPGVVWFGSGEISRECCLEEVFFKRGVTGERRGHLPS